MRFAAWLGMASSPDLGRGFPGCIPDGTGVSGPLLVAGVAGFEALAFASRRGAAR
jgi:hypothetical protein